MTKKNAKPRTQKQARAGIEKLFEFWKDALNLNDLLVTFFEDTGPNDRGTLMEVKAASEGEDMAHAYVTVFAMALTETAPGLSEAACHELLHVHQWPIKYALAGIAEEQLSLAQSRLIGPLVSRANEETTLRLERVMLAHVKPPAALLKF